MTDDRIVRDERAYDGPERVRVETQERRDDGAGLVPDYMGDAFRSRVSWGAIFAGTVVGVGVLLMLSLAGLAFGLSSADFGPGENGMSGIPTGAGIWLVISQLIALAIGGYVAGRLAAVPKTSSSALHGAAVWGLATLLMAYMASNAVSGVFNTATSAIGSAVTTVAQIAPAVGAPSQQTQNEMAAQTDQIVNSVLSDREKNRAVGAVQNSAQAVAEGDATVGEAVRNVTNQLFGNGGVIGPDDRRQAATVLAQRTGMTQAEAEATFDNVQGKVQQMARTAPATVNNALTEGSDALAGIAFWAFVASLLGLIAATVAATFGRPGAHTETRRT